MIEQVVEYWYVVLPLVFILHKVFDMWHTRRLMKQLGAAPVTNQLHDNFWYYQRMEST